MLARHPLTGKDIRIISLDTSVWKENKTLVWLEAAEESVPWSRYDVGVTSVAAAVALKSRGIQADLVLCLGDHKETAAWCQSGEWSKARIVAVPRAFVEFMGFEALMKLRMGNIMCLDEAHELYPFIGGRWDGSVADAQILMAAILQTRRTFPIESTPGQRTIAGLQVMNSSVKPQPLWLITQYYKPEKAARRNEIQTCLTKNMDCPLVDKIILLNETACAPKHKKVEEHVIGKRLTYADVIRWVYEKAPPNIMVAFANADIFIDGDSWRGLWSTDLESQAKFLALLRWDVEDAELTNAKIFSNQSGPPRVDSQDTWVLASNSVKAVSWDWDALNFPFGKGGCDNAITVEMFKKRFLVANPSLTLKTYHLHASGVRGYNPADIVDKPVYLYIHPTGLHDKKPVLDLDSVGEPRRLSFTAFERRIAGPLSATQARTFCTMIGRATQGEVSLEVDGPNLWSPSPVSLYPVSNVFQTRDGLVYNHDSIFVGQTKAAAKAWSESQISYLSPSLQVDNAMIAPLPDAIASNPGRFVLEYMSKVFLLRDKFGAAGEFWCSKEPACVEALKMFSWAAQEIPVLSRDENQQTWCTKGAMWPHQEVTLISREEVNALRGALGGWKEDAGKTLVIVVDAKWVTDEVADAIEVEGLTVKIIWAGRTSLDASLHALRGAWGVILADMKLSHWLWAAPRGAFVWEIQSEMEPSLNLLHLAAAAELKHRLTIVPRSSNDVEKKALTEKLLADIRACFEPKLEKISGKPKLFMPKGHTGFYAHAGDSFREIAALWAERGYVDLVPSSSHQVWLHAVGDTLLYDRPTHQWLERAPPNERTFRKALFGNPAPAPGGSPWSFWPRRPALVEAAAARGLRPWESRDQSVVFYGRSENAVQKSRRSTDWSTACSEFVHVDGLSKYPYTAEEYLERLANSRYGLCLAGYGFKCHREIECMAMGTVPIVAPEVDMESYAEPPEEGLHYLRAAKPEDVAPLVKNITAERWTMMSAACRSWWIRNASVDGMWALTQSLI
jgi:hypothetical protein